MRVPNVASTPPASDRPFATAVRRLAFTGRSCSNCGSSDIRPSQSRNTLDVLLACLFLTPFRCRFCRDRFYRFWRPSLFQETPRAPAAPAAPLLIMPARRAIPNPEPEPIPRIEPQPLPPPRTHPRLIPPTKKATVTSAFIERIEAGMRSPRPLPDTTPGTVLILESDLSIRKLLRRLLERRGYSAVEVAQAVDLKNELDKHLPDLLVIDFSGSSDSSAGEQALVTLARAHPGLKILALSTEGPLPYAMSDRMQTLPKPFSLDRFVDCVNRLLGTEPRP